MDEIPPIFAEATMGTRSDRDDAQREIGEIVICPSYVRQQAKRAGEALRRELSRVIVHGMLHLFGYDHAAPSDAEQMFALQERIVVGGDRDAVGNSKT